ncbi:MAG: nitrilase-related carbon-nitrogen hydrolase [Candidatus Edwardsbacteria bacterium]
MRIGFLQFCPKFGEKEENLKKVKHLLKSIRADLVVLPELFNTGYLFYSKDELAKFSEEIPEGPTTEALLNLAKSQRLNLVAGLAERRGNKFFNSAILVSSKGEVKTYRKIHLFYKERFLFTPGDKPFAVFQIGSTKIGIVICFDWIFPEAIRVLTLKGAQIICHPANLVLPYCQKAMITRAIENRVFVITANRTSSERRGGQSLKFTGKSQIVDPQGQVLAKTNSRAEIVKVIDIDSALALNKKITEYNDIFKDRRVRFYQRITV